MRVLTWNLFHGRSQPPAGRELSASFAAALAGWEWDAALLQEVPPWWPSLLAGACGADSRAARTSRNFGLPLRKAIAVRWPDLIKSNGGGCNAILATAPIADHRVMRLRALPERRVGLLVRLQDETCLVNFHGSSRPELAEAELETLWEGALAFCAGSPLVLGGDLNLRRPSAPSAQIAHVAHRDVDHLFARGFAQRGRAEVLDRRLTVGARLVEMSDHPPLVCTLCAPTARAAQDAGVS